MSYTVDGLPSAGSARDNTCEQPVPDPPSPDEIETPEPMRGLLTEVSDETTFAELTTMRVGGKPERIVVAKNSNELVRYASQLWAGDEPWLLLGGGSNTVVCDEGFSGTVVLVRGSGITYVEDESLPAGYVRVRVEAGQDWDTLVEWTVREELAGIEMLSGIPGLAGAAPVQNIRAYGGELAQVLHSIVVYDRDRDEVLRLAASDLDLEYRSSVLKQGYEAVVLSIDLLLRQSPESEPIVFPQLAKALGVKLGVRMPLVQVRDTVLRLRASKGMVLSEIDHDTWSAGSFFTNPIVTERFSRTLPGDAPRFQMGHKEPKQQITLLKELEQGGELRVARTGYEADVKLSAAWLIEQAGVRRGLRLPGSGAAISTKHTLAITNLGGASAADVAELARYVVSMVQAEFGLVLVPEPNLYGLEI